MARQVYSNYPDKKKSTSGLFSVPPLGYWLLAIGYWRSAGRARGSPLTISRRNRSGRRSVYFRYSRASLGPHFPDSLSRRDTPIVHTPSPHHFSPSLLP